MTAALEIAGLTKRFGDRVAVDHLDLAIPRGEFHALLGPNGAGKTTTLRIVAGITRADEGVVRVLGRDVERDADAAKRMLAFIPDEPPLYGRLRPLEYLGFVAGLWRMEGKVARRRGAELLEELGLADKRGDFVESFSRGMRQKLALAGALIHDPAVMLLDEPLTGLDAAAARQVKDILLARVRAGCTVVLTTHILEVAERLAERISIIAGGRIVAQGNMAELRARAGRGETLEEVFLALVRDAAADAPR
ncbi:MAG: ABC transporter ATP-binding protein [Betaproteobacteria bacterium]